MPGRPTAQEIATAIEAFIRDVGAVSPDDTLFDRDIDLYDTGYVDSLCTVALTAFLQETFRLTLSEDDLFDPDHSTINGLTRLVTHRRAAGS
ncbi:acyl carrier protein (plasmid) [Kitasatospora sp. NBC_00374]|uniref:acyl carrier protein n=1 Tax=Kitasatospora sp. NBC_00374 TaxID=2975964 RepID=UPI002F9069D1